MILTNQCWIIRGEARDVRAAIVIPWLGLGIAVLGDWRLYAGKIDRAPKPDHVRREDR